MRGLSLLLPWTAGLLIAACSHGAPVSDAGLDAQPDAEVASPDIKGNDLAADVPGAPADVAQAELDAAVETVDADVPRADASDTADGEKIVVIDTAGSATPIDCTGCKWEKIGFMAQHRINFGAAWSGEHLYVFGGQTSLWAYMNDKFASPPYSNGMNNTAERWDPKTNTRETLAQPPLWPQDNARLVWGGDRPYVVPSSWFGLGKGWQPLKDAVTAYVPAQKRWEVLPAENGPGVRGTPGVAWTGKRLLVLGGGGGKMVHTGHAYDPAQGKWEILPEPPLPPNFWAICGGWTGNAYMMWTGSVDPVALKWHLSLGLIWHEAQGKWEQFGPPPGLDFEEPSPGGPSTCVGVKSGLFIWGRTGKELPKPYDGWLRRADSPIWEHVAIPAWLSPKIFGTHVAWDGKYVVIWGGDTAIGGKPNETGLLYDPEAHLWLRLPKLGAPYARVEAGFTQAPGQFFVVGGLDGLSPDFNTWFLDGGRLFVPP